MSKTAEGKRLREVAEARTRELRAAARDHEREAATLYARADIIARTWQLDREEPQDA